MRGAPARHSRQAHAIVDNVKNLTIGQALCLRQPQVRSLRIEVGAHFCLSAAIIRMAGGAMIGEVLPPGRYVFRSGGVRIFFVLRTARNRQAARTACERLFERRWFVPSTKASTN